MSDIFAGSNASGQGGVPGEPVVYEGPAADLPWVEPEEADLAALEAGPATWDAVQERIEYLLTQQAVLRAVVALGPRRTRRQVSQVLTAALRVQGVA